MTYDVTVIGSGPGGYVAAIRCAQLGMKTAIIERYPTLGGTCLNVGCIPSKALLDSSELFYNAKTHFATHGIDVKGLAVNWPQMQKRKDKVVADSNSGIKYLMTKNKIDAFEGHASFVDAQTIAITPPPTPLNPPASRGTEDPPSPVNGGEKRIETKRVIIATGSKPMSLPFAPLDKKRIISSTEALSLADVPGEMIVIGAGVIGVEMGSVFQRLGTKVSVVELLGSVIPTMDGTMGKELQRSLTKLGMKFYLSHQVKNIEVRGERVKVVAENRAMQSAPTTELEADYCLVAVGRRPYTDNLGLEKIGVAIDKGGFVRVNKNLETSVPGVFAIGDVIGGAMLAHKAEEEGIYVAERMAGQKPHINYNAIPNVVYTWPEVASVGYSEEDLKRMGREYKVGAFSYKPLGRARAANESEGLVKVLADKQTDEILGVHMIGARTADMIAEAVVALEYRASAEDIARISHAHPTFTEAFREACLDATGKRAIHM